MPVTIGSNIASLQVQRGLAESSAEYGSALERLASGLRINRASDDAAGLSIASSLRADVRVQQQAVRNLNDGISAISIVDAGVQELKGITTRIAELAEQSSNGTLSNEQRRALDTEVQALQSEFNRITVTMKFNGVPLAGPGSNAVLTLQAGYGEEGALRLLLAPENPTAQGLGTFTSVGQFSSQASGGTIHTADLDGDGNLDVIQSNSSYQGSRVYFGNGDGSLRAPIVLEASQPGYQFNIDSGDIDGDGDGDIAFLSSDGENLLVFRNDGGGSFSSAYTWTGAGGGRQLSLMDFNGDGVLDIGTTTQGYALVHLGVGNGTFQSPTTVATFGTGVTIQSSFGDFNGDGHIDIARLADTRTELFLGDGTGSFSAGPVIVTTEGDGISDVGDINGDGFDDIVHSRIFSSSIGVYLGGAGGFSTSMVTMPTAGRARLGDMNGDGILDIVHSSGSTLSVLYGNGDGTFTAGVTSTVPAGTNTLGIGDLDGDGVPDVVSHSSGSVTVLAQDVSVAIAPALALQHGFSVATRSDGLASLDRTRTLLETLNLVTATLGASRSRIEIAIELSRSIAEGSAAAESRIVDADIADESSRAVRASILQQAAAAVLAQANQAPALALTLLA